MKIYFTETENAEQQFFAKHFQGHELQFAERPEDVPADADIVSIFIHTKIDAAFLESHPRLRLVATRSSGVDLIDLAECARRHVQISNAAGYGDSTVAEHTFALILALSRRLRQSIEAQRKTPASLESIRAFDLKGKTLGVVGVGRIGSHVVRIAKAFEMEVLAYDVQAPSALAESAGFRFVPLDELLAAAHVISLHIPLTSETHHLFNRKAFAKCRRGVLIVNTARGGVIDTADLNEALEKGIVGGAGLDVLEDERLLQQEHASIISNQIVSNLQNQSPHEAHRNNPERVQELQSLIENSKLLVRPDVVFTPHTAFNSVEAVERINLLTLENINGFLEGKPVNLVPLPAV